ncbi:hypothetical protein I6H96_02335 [Brucella anthropi]|uniref:hypothetical protein n=1 Tax=Brucella anthropi TaxID=529 RepID=UPI0003058815|nr:hypothetical protein [Brucella anthropi]QQC25721.1 hypothetical protein I6H96_02335 [Brucella anthropi]
MLKQALIGLTFAALFAGHASAQAAGDFLSGSCADDANKPFCESAAKDFKKRFPLAYKGDYQSQRNVAFCLSSGCDGAVIRKPIFACAWRLVIITSGSPDVDQSDTANTDADCGKLSEIDRLTAAAQAKEIIGRLSK